MTKLLGTGGVARAGKDAVLDILIEEPGEEWAKTYMSKALETALLILNPSIDILWSNWKDDSWSKVYDLLRYEGPRWIMFYQDLHALLGYEMSKENNGVRDALQKLGTEIGRNMFDENVWVNIAFAEVDEALEAGTNIGITGMRYPNELDYIHDRGGLTVWVSRPGYGPVNGHSSDNTLGPEDFDLVIENNGTLEDLRRTALYMVSMYDKYQRLDSQEAA